MATKKQNFQRFRKFIMRGMLGTASQQIRYVLAHGEYLTQTECFKLNICLDYLYSITSSYNENTKLLERRL